MKKSKDIKKLNSMDEFDRLVENLCTGELGLKHLEIAYAEYIRRNPVIPEGVKNLLVRYTEYENGLLHKLWLQIGQTVGTVELSYRRGGFSDKEIK